MAGRELVYALLFESFVPLTHRVRCYCCWGLLASSWGCAPAALPSPESAVEEYYEAVRTQDARLLHSRLTRRAREALSQKELADSLNENQDELKVRAAEFASPDVVPVVDATMFLKGGREAHLHFEGSSFRIDPLGVTPSHPQSPTEVLKLLREAVSTKKVELFLALLSREGQRAFQSHLESLEASLEQLNSAIVEIRQDRAVIELPDGLVLELVQERGAWRIEDLR